MCLSSKPCCLNVMYHSSKTISTLSTGNTGSDPSSKSRLPTSLRSSLFLQKTQKPSLFSVGREKKKKKLDSAVGLEHIPAVFVLLFSCSKQRESSKGIKPNTGGNNSGLLLLLFKKIKKMNASLPR